MTIKETWSQLGWEKKIAAIAGIVFLLIFIPISVQWLLYRFTHAITNDAFVETDLINISPLVPGHIKTLYVDESYTIKQGQPLAFIDDRDYSAQVAIRAAELERGEKELATVRVTLERTKREVDQQIAYTEEALKEAHENQTRANAHYVKTERDYERLKNLFERKVIPKTKFDAIEAEYISSKANLSSAEILIKMRGIEREKALTGRYLAEELKKKVNALESAVQVARESLEAAKINLDHTRVISPVNGVVAKKFLFEGDYVSPGFPIFSIYDKDNIFVRAHLEETKMGGVKLGQVVDIKVDAYPGKIFKGRLIKIGEASGAKFSLIPRDTTTGEFTKVVQRIPIKIAVNDPKKLLIPGYAVEVGIEVKRARK
ncbi:MAG: HlyD family secretion protein [Proteobacteria bacterium]|nr:HlyD family secretion protein [Pseudomonadota bacterium]